MVDRIRQVELWDPQSALQVLELIAAGYRVQSVTGGIQIVVAGKGVREYCPGDNIPAPETLERELAQERREERLRQGTLHSN